jgi:hypothetical protein
MRAILIILSVCYIVDATVFEGHFMRLILYKVQEQSRATSRALQNWLVLS